MASHGCRASSQPAFDIGANRGLLGRLVLLGRACRLFDLGPLLSDLRFYTATHPDFIFWGAAATEVHRAACSPQGTRAATGFIRATPLSEGPRSPALRLIAGCERSTKRL